MDDDTTTDFLGTRLRHLIDQLETDVARVYADLGLPGFRPRYAPVIRLVHTRGPQSIRDLATTIGVTHSALSQTANQMRRDGLVELHPGADARQRVVHLTERTKTLLPTVNAEWDATAAAARELDAELPHPLGHLVEQALHALARRPLRDRIHHHLRTPDQGSAHDQGSTPSQGNDPG